MSKTIYDNVMGQSTTTDELRAAWREIRLLDGLKAKEHEAYGLCLDYFAAMLDTLDADDYALRNCYALANRQKGKGLWAHVIRFCEDAGLKRTILRNPAPLRGNESEEIN